MKALYYSVWDGGTEIVTNCQFTPETMAVSDIDTADVDGLDILEEEYVICDGVKYNVLQFDKFKDLWIEQETKNSDDEESLEDVLNECEDFEDFFKIASSWSHTPLDVRLITFLERNNGCYIDDYGYFLIN